MNAETLPSGATATKIAKLLNLAKSATDETEADLAMKRAHEMLAKYNLSMAEVEAHNPNNAASPDLGERKKDNAPGGFYRFQVLLWNAVAKLNFCSLYLQQYYDVTLAKPKRRQRFVIFGREANIAATKLMASYLEETVKTLAADRIRQRWPHYDKRRQAQQSFSRDMIDWRNGCVDRIVSRLNKRRMDAEQAKESTAAPSTSTALVLASHYKKEEEANTALAKATFTKIGKSNNYEVRDSASYNAGWSKGGEVGIDTQLNGAKVRGQLGQG